MGLVSRGPFFDLQAEKKCERGDSNPQGLPHRILNPACLPVSPLSQLNPYILYPRIWINRLAGSAGRRRRLRTPVPETR